MGEEEGQRDDHGKAEIVGYISSGRLRLLRLILPAKRVGNLIYVAGQLPMKDGKLMATGQVPSKCSIELAIEAAKQCVINGLAAVNGLPGGVDQIVGVARVGAFVSSDSSFTEQPKIANGAQRFVAADFRPGGAARAGGGGGEYASAGWISGDRIYFRVQFRLNIPQT